MAQSTFPSTTFRNAYDAGLFSYSPDSTTSEELCPHDSIHPYPVIEARKRRKAWNHVLEKAIFTSDEMQANLSASSSYLYTDVYVNPDPMNQLPSAVKSTCRASRLTLMLCMTSSFSLSIYKNCCPITHLLRPHRLGLWPVPAKELERHKGLNSKTAKVVLIFGNAIYSASSFQSMVAKLHHNVALTQIKISQYEKMVRAPVTKVRRA